MRECVDVAVAVQTQELLCAHVDWFEFDDFVSQLGLTSPPFTLLRAPVADMSPIPDELTATVISAVGSLSALQKAKFLLEHSLALLEAGQ